MFNEKRIKKLINTKYEKGGIAYWMSRDQRVSDNWALIRAYELATQNNVGLSVIFVLQNDFLDANALHYDFMISGLKEVEEELHKLNIPFQILFGDPDLVIPKYIDQNNIGALITDLSPLKIAIDWKKKIAEKIKNPFEIIDSHNIIPVWEASNKQEYSAYTLRSKYNKIIDAYLTEYPKLEPIKNSSRSNYDGNDWADITDKYANIGISKKYHLPSGSQKAEIHLKNFIKDKLINYGQFKNDPNKDLVSGLSPYLHFGQISSQRIALQIKTSDIPDDVKATFLEELIIRKELADNFCYYNSNYDLFEGFPNWAKKTLDKHRKDKREFIYTREQFENAQTHDDLWNAAQKELTETAKMHGYLRMYWAKKILEWSRSPEDAISIAIYLNDHYSIDGRDPNGYTGIAWSIGGVHDRPWMERETFGMIRYMNYNGCKRKFDTEQYINKFIKQ